MYYIHSWPFILSRIWTWDQSDCILYLKLRYHCLRPLSHHGWVSYQNFVKFLTFISSVSNFICAAACNTYLCWSFPLTQDFPRAVANRFILHSNKSSDIHSDNTYSNILSYSKYATLAWLGHLLGLPPSPLYCPVLLSPPPNPPPFLCRGGGGGSVRVNSDPVWKLWHFPLRCKFAGFGLTQWVSKNYPWTFQGQILWIWLDEISVRSKSRVRWYFGAQQLFEGWEQLQKRCNSSGISFK